MEMKKGDNLTKQQIKIFRGGNKPDQQAMDVYKSKTNEAKTSLTSRLRTATKQKSKRRRTKPDQQATNSKATNAIVCRFLMLPFVLIFLSYSS